MCRSLQEGCFIQKMMMPLINDLLTRLLGLYHKYEVLTFTHCPCKLKPYKKLGFVFPSTDQVTWLVNS